MSTLVAIVLRNARAKIKKPECWTTKVFARDKNGRQVGPRDYDAVCWCGVGAIEAVSQDGSLCDKAQYILNEVTDEIFVDFNDSQPHAKVLAAFDRAIAFAEAQS
jgi:hypothetical protein